VTNLTSLGMKAYGGLGEDSLYGGDALDTLDGGANDDKLRGDGASTGSGRSRIVGRQVLRAARV
jgi:Ca2+-binding RTX toxin-like protein